MFKIHVSLHCVIEFHNISNFCNCQNTHIDPQWSIPGILNAAVVDLPSFKGSQKLDRQEPKHQRFRSRHKERKKWLIMKVHGEKLVLFRGFIPLLSPEKVVNNPIISACSLEVNS